MLITKEEKSFLGHRIRIAWGGYMGRRENSHNFIAK
jgi:hypothetical protein